mmetsp:Transcript_18106/g.45479  ORF Transcript_18106/g.45479 Transcript_18106/m.45479 type:complete len:244 (+) Transcript_18106:63-794(+)
MANQLRKDIEEGRVAKVYVARVRGVFPEGDVRNDSALGWNPKTNYAFCVREGQGEGAPQAAGQGASAGKAASTQFRRLHLAADGRSSLVECRPLTGRTHQIRVHLQDLGYPIANDPQYGAAAPAEACKRKDCPDQQSSEAAKVATADAGGSKRQCLSGAACEAAGAPSAAGDGEALPYGAVDEVDAARDSLCMHCPSITPVGYPVNLRAIWLHALRYTFGSDGQSYSTELPPWASESFEGDGE